MRRLVLVLVLAMLARVVHATTYVVDAGGTGDFFDVQSAINAAQPGDVLLVSPGNYPGFTLDKGLIVIGYDPVTITGAISVTNIPVGPPVALVRLRPRDVTVSGCFGTVLLEGLAHMHSLSVTQSNDVRAAHVEVDASGSVMPGGHDGISVVDSRLELVDSMDKAEPGGFAGTPGFPGFGGLGGSGLRIGPSARVHCVRSTIIGGNGGAAGSITQNGGMGGPAVESSSPCEIFLVGSPSSASSLLLGGSGGLSSLHTVFGDCSADGLGSCAILGTGTVWHSQTTIQGGHSNQDFNCAPSADHTEPAFCLPGPIDMPVSPADPGLMLTGTVAAGSIVTLSVDGEPGASVVLRLGRGALVTATPGADIEMLTGANLSVALGPIPPGGSIAHQLALPSSYARGTLFYCQADVMGTGGLKRTNSVPLIVR